MQNGLYQLGSWMWGKQKVSFASPYDIPETIHLLQSILQRPFPFTRVGADGITGHVSSKGVFLRRMQSTPFKSGFAVNFYGQVVPEDNAAAVVGYFAQAIYPRIFMAVWFSFVCAGFAAMLIRAILLFTMDAFVASTSCALFPVGGITRLALSRRINRDDIPFLAQKVKAALENSRAARDT